MALTGTETLQVLGQNATGKPASSSFTTTTQEIADLGSGGGGGIVVGTSITGGSANRVLFEDISNNLAEDANFTYNADISVFNVGFTTNSTSFNINDSAKSINAVSNTSFSYADSSGNKSFQTQSSDSYGALGDLDGKNNSTSIRVVDSTKIIYNFVTDTYLIADPSGNTVFRAEPSNLNITTGDYDGAIPNGAKLTMINNDPTPYGAGSIGGNSVFEWKYDSILTQRVFRFVSDFIIDGSSKLFIDAAQRRIYDATVSPKLSASFSSRAFYNDVADTIFEYAGTSMVRAGDLDGSDLGDKLTINYHTGDSYFNSSGTFAIKDLAGINKLFVDIASDLVIVSTTFNLSATPEFANNAAAIIGGLSVGDVYQTTVGGDAFLKRVI